MRTFGGEFSKQQKVSLVGRSKQVESREEILERTRQERERRRQKKLEEENAVVIQAAWRAYAARQIAQQEIRVAWLGKYGADSVLHQIHEGDDWKERKKCVSEFCYFAHPDVWSDVGELGRLCEALQRGRVFQSPDVRLFENNFILSIRDVFQLVITALASHRDRFKSSLERPAVNLEWSDLSLHGAEERVFVQLFRFAMNALTSSSMNIEARKIMLGYKYRSFQGQGSKGSLFLHLAQLLETGCPRDGTVGRTSAAGTLVTHCLVSFLGCFGESQYGGHSVLDILYAPSIFTRCPSLAPIKGKLWRMGLNYIQSSTACLPENVLDFFGGIQGDTMVSLLENLTHGLSAGLERSKSQLEPRREGHQGKAFMQLVSNALKSHDQSTREGAIRCLKLISNVDNLVALVQGLQLSSNLSQTDIWPQYIENDSEVESICSFVSCIQIYSSDRLLHARIMLSLVLKAGLSQMLWWRYLKPHVKNELHLRHSSVWMEPLALFCELMALVLVVRGDDGLYDAGVPIPLSEVYNTESPKTGLLYLLKTCLWNVLWNENRKNPGTEGKHGNLRRKKFLRSAGKLLSLLHDRNGRRPFAPLTAFYAEKLPIESFHSAAAASIDREELERLHHSDMSLGGDSEEEVESEDNKVLEVLLFASPLVPFLERVKILQSLISKERSSIGDDSLPMGMLFGSHATGDDRFITVHRGRVLEDAYQSIGQSKKRDIKRRLRIAFINEFGESEAGIDGGGVFKEFLENVIKEAVSPSLGLFRSTTDNKLYPSPIAAYKDSEAFKKIEFVGLMVGKALWEGILLDLPLAPFFLKKFRGTQCGVDDLPALDPELARSLKFLINNPDTIEDMGLTFTLTDSNVAPFKEVELIPGGASICVTQENVAQFVQRVAEFKLNEQIQFPCEYFLRGFHSVIPKEWVASFNDVELQMLIGGAEGDHALDLRDMKAHVIYSGGYSIDHPVIQAFWEAMESLSRKQHADFLRFVTSCPRPPLLGFGSLEPPLTIQMVSVDDSDGHKEVDRLPTAATCLNLLKLPAYKGGVNVLRSKLAYAIEAHAGFDLS